MGTTIVVQNGGTVAQDAPVTWQNTASQKVHVTGLAGIVANGEFHVPASGNGKSGEHGGSILPNAPTGDHIYTITPSATETTATLTVNRSSPK
jgi:hypothetical protein